MFAAPEDSAQTETVSKWNEREQPLPLRIRQWQNVHATKTAQQKSNLYRLIVLVLPTAVQVIKSQ